MRKLNKVLLVDDDHVANFLNKGIIEKADCAEEVILKSNGRDAFDYLEKECNKEQFPDLILLDLNMPVMDGFEFLKEFERICYNKSDQVVIVILTNSRNADDYIKLLDIGVYYYVLEKPLDANKLSDIRYRYFKDNKIH